MPIVVSPWEVRFKNHTIFGQTAKEALSHAKEEIERCEAKGISWDLHCKSPQEVAIEESYNKGWDAGSESGYELGRLSIFEKQLKTTSIDKGPRHQASPEGINIKRIVYVHDNDSLLRCIA